MDELFTTQAVSQTFGVSHQTVKNWSDEFVDFLSPTATPPKGRRRVFTLDDMRVFALVHDYHKRGHTYADAQTALAAGQRGDMPEQGTTPLAVPPALVIQLRQELATREQLIETLKTERDMERGKAQFLERQLQEKEELIRDLYKQVARLEAQLPSKDDE